MMGTAHYRTHLHIVTGWIHHVVYVLIVRVAIKRSWTRILILSLRIYGGERSA